MQNVLVTGTSSGIGRACVLALSKAGFRVFATVRKDADAERLREIDQVEPLMLDLTDQDSIDAAAKELQEKLGDEGLHGLVNNAGLAIPGPVEILPIEDLRRQIEINLIGQIAVTQACLPLLRKAQGRIINMSSMSGRITFPFMGAYCASKHGLEAISDALRLELAPWKIKVILVQPGRIKTNIFDRAKGDLDVMQEKVQKGDGLYSEIMDGAHNMTRDAEAKGISSDAVGNVIVRAMTSRRPLTRYIVGTDSIAAIWARNLLPDFLLDPLVQFLFKRAIEGKTI